MTTSKKRVIKVIEKHKHILPVPFHQLIITDKKTLKKVYNTRKIVSIKELETWSYLVTKSYKPISKILFK